MIHLTFLARARGFTLLVAVIFTSVVLTVALALSAIAESFLCCRLSS
jgi:hypothetical protein